MKVLLTVYPILNPVFLTGIGAFVAIIFLMWLSGRVGRWTIKKGRTEQHARYNAEDTIEPNKIAVSELAVPCMLYIYGSMVPNEPIVSYIDPESEKTGYFILTGYVGPKLISKRQYHVDTNRTFRPG